MKLLMYIALIVVFGLVLLRLLYTGFFSSLFAGYSVETLEILCFILVIATLLACLVCLVVLNNKLNNRTKALAEAHNDFIDKVSKFADDYNEHKTKVIDTLSVHNDRINKLEESK